MRINDQTREIDVTHENSVTMRIVTVIQKRSCESEDDRRLGIRRSDSGRRFDESDETMQCDEKLPRSNCVWYNGLSVDWNSLDQAMLREREEI